MNKNNELNSFLKDAQSGEISFEQSIMLGIQMARAKGFEEGFEKGTVFGYALCMEHMKSTISDGLRHGSPECGKAMRARKNKANE